MWQLTMRYAPLACLASNCGRPFFGVSYGSASRKIMKRQSGSLRPVRALLFAISAAPTGSTLPSYMKPTPKGEWYVFTKHFTNEVKWDHAIELIGHVDPQRLWSRGGRSPASGGHSPERRGSDDQNAGGKKQAAPATDPEPCEPRRTMIEFCCGHDSLLGQPTKSSMNVRLSVLPKTRMSPPRKVFL